MKKIFKYLIVFGISLFLLLFTYNLFFGDSIVNYGFSYAIVRGEIPYNDFNLVLPLFSPWFYAIPLLIYNSNITFYITQAILLTVLYYLIEKKLGYKIYLFCFLLFLTYPYALVTGLFPGYNFLLFFLIFILSYIDKDTTNDYLIGFLIGLCIITKHTIGVFLIIPSIIFYYKDIKKLLKRLGGLLIPCFIFLIYLLITKSFYNFLNLCVFGLFDFAKSNTYSSSIFLIITFILLMVYFIYILKNNKNISYYYLFLTFLFVMPLFEIFHLSYFLISCLYVFIDRIKIDKTYKKFTCILFVFIICVWTFIMNVVYNYKYINFNNYPFRYSSERMLDNYNYVSSIYKKYDNVVLFLIGSDNYFNKITRDLDITYFDLTNYGNYGYDSFNMMKKRIDNNKSCYYVVSVTTLKHHYNGQQYYKELANYIIEKGKLVESNGRFSVYYIE